ncbi:MAG: M48 family metalloprotease [Desulfotignum sp.]|nr:M48 family metalloprotease [Desulfobacteraceae bacterium]
MKHLQNAITVLIICFVLLTGLPAVSFAISIPDEKKLADKFMKMIQEERGILDDPAASHLINTVGRHILIRLPPQPFTYTFYLVDDDTFNAFASPGANIFIHRGLITALSSTDELAGILAHEIAHAASRHVSESIDRSKIVGIGSMAGVLAGVLIGSAGGGDAAQALTVGSMAAGQSAMLAFTRENETEADQKAFSMLKQTAYSPEGLLDSLNILRAADFRGIEGIPDYFKTHPGTGNRIAHLAALLSTYLPPEQPISAPDTYDYNMVKYRLMGLYEDTGKSIQKIETQLANDISESHRKACHYGLGLLSARENRRDKAILHLQKALSFDLLDPLVLVELGRVYTIDGQYEKALDLLLGIQSDPILGTMARYHLARTQLALGDLLSARKNLNQVTAISPRAFPRAYFHLANIMSRENKTALSHYYLGLYYEMIKDWKNAARHLTKALDEGLEDTDIKNAAQERLKGISKDKPSS